MVLTRMEEWAIRGLHRLARRVRGPEAGPDHLQTGLRGEQEALFALRRAGYTVVARRWTTPKVRGDLDVVAWDGATLCFLEVKSRAVRDAVPAETAVDRSKRIQLRRLAAVYLRSFNEVERRSIVSRFDVVSVYLPAAGAECEILSGAFGWAEGGWQN